MAEIHFRLTHADYQRLSQRVYRRWPRRWRWASQSYCVIAGMGFGAVGALYLRLHERLPWVPPLYAVVGVLAVVTWVFTFAVPLVLPRLAMRLAWREDGNFLLPQTLRFDEQGLAFDGARMSTRLAWSQVLARDEDVHNVYLFVDAAQAFIVPKAALAPVWADFEPLLKGVPAGFP